MKNFLLLVLALGLTGSAFLTRPDREEFDAYLRRRNQPDDSTAVEASGTSSIHIARKASAAALARGGTDAIDTEKLEFKDYYLWTVVRNKDGKSLFTGVFDHWVDNEQIRRCLPSDGKAESK
jgi:hypothetical protein